jgi:very-short-patch-repair endonuclease
VGTPDFGGSCALTCFEPHRSEIRWAGSFVRKPDANPRRQAVREPTHQNLDTTETRSTPGGYSIRQISIHDQFGTFLARPDLVYRDLKIAMEYDSFQYHVGKEALVRDSRRRNAIAALGWIVLVATAEDVRYGNGAQFARDVQNARRTRELASIHRV